VSTESRQIELAEFSNMIRTEEQRRVFARLLRAFGVNSGTFSENHARQSYAEGRRSAGQHILDEAREADPALFLKLITELHADG